MLTLASVRRVGPYRISESREIYRNPWISVREDRVLRADGTPGVFGVVEMKPGSSVLALDRNEDVFLIREFKFGVERETLELISGAIDEGESPLDAARRELREEAGVEARRWVDLGVVDPFTTVIRSPNYLFLALDLHQVERRLDPGEVLEPARVPFAEALRMVMSSEITHAASCTLLLKAERYLRSDSDIRGRLGLGQT